MTDAVKPITYADLLRAKQEKRKIVMTTAYSAWQARLADSAGVDALIVGDSAGHVEDGFLSTTPVRLPEMLLRTTSCWRGARRQFLIGDAPFGSTEVSIEQAIETAVELIRHGASCVKLEGPRFSVIKAIADVGILVQGHIGLTPQQKARFGGYKVQARLAKEALLLRDEARRIEDAGAALLLLEAVPPEVGKIVSESIHIPCIGVGAGPYTDGQCVIQLDLTGIFEDWKPTFARRYMEGGRLIREALSQYVADVRAGAFPGPPECYKMLPGEAEKLKEGLDQ